VQRFLRLHFAQVSGCDVDDAGVHADLPFREGHGRAGDYRNAPPGLIAKMLRSRFRAIWRV